jgi:hypothetical protein
MNGPVARVAVAALLSLGCLLLSGCSDDAQEGAKAAPACKDTDDPAFNSGSDCDTFCLNLTADCATSFSGPTECSKDCAAHLTSDAICCRDYQASLGNCEAALGGGVCANRH